jgi:hypothetical protein
MMVIAAIVLVLAIAGWLGMRMMGSKAAPDPTAQGDSTKSPAAAAPAATGTTTPPAATKP